MNLDDRSKEYQSWGKTRIMRVLFDEDESLIKKRSFELALNKVDQRN
jgi:hypothetical protein